MPDSDIASPRFFRDTYYNLQQWHLQVHSSMVAPQFSIHQIRYKNGKPFTQVLDFLETSDIDPEKQDETKRGMEINQNDV